MNSRIQKLSQSKKTSAFTLVEVMVVVLIIAIIATLVMVMYSSTRMKVRDAKRVTSINTLQLALNAYYQDHGAYPAVITAGIPLKNSTGTKIYLDEVPFNPQPKTDHNCSNLEYIYKVSANKQAYSLSACIGANNNPSNSKLIYGTKDGIFHCGDRITDRDGFTYGTVTIGSQCWMSENLKTRTLPNGNCINQFTGLRVPADTLTFPTAPSCTWTQVGTGNIYGSYSLLDGRECESAAGTQGTEADCVAGRTLYNLQHALQCYKGATGTCPPQIDPNTMCCNDTWVNNVDIQGICPDGWHVPTGNEFATLEQYLADPPVTVASCDPARSNQGCTSAGTKLKAGGSSGFNSILLGRRNGTSIGESVAPFSTLPPPFSGTAFRLMGIYDWFISADMTGNTAWMRALTNTDSGVWRLSQNIDVRAWSLRCIKT